MSPTSDDYYELLGVDPSAQTDEIRDRYRSRREELNAKDNDDARSESALLNRAWNVLSDPYQRGRYDAQRESDGDDAPVDDVEVVDEAPPRRRRGLLDAGPARSGGRERPARATATITLPTGQAFAETRPRLIAMVIDLVVVAAIFFGGAYGLGSKYINDKFPDKVHQLNTLRDQRDAAQTRANDLADAANKADDKVTTLQKQNASASDIAAAKAAAKTADARSKAADQRVTTLRKRYDNVAGDLTPTQLTFIEIAMLVGLLYLAIPSSFSGQTLGKRLQRIRVERADGGPLGWSGAFVRYGALAIATNLLFFLLAWIAGVLVIVGVIGWMRNPNRQGLHDRLAKTVVVKA